MLKQIKTGEPNNISVIWNVDKFAIGMVTLFEQHIRTKTKNFMMSWMETFSALLAICAGIHRSPVTGEFPHKGQWRGALVIFLICAWINDWVNNGEAGDLRLHRAHYDATVMQGQGQIHVLTSHS